MAWCRPGILLFGPLGKNCSENLIGIQNIFIKKMYIKMSAAKWRPFCLGLNVLNCCGPVTTHGVLKFGILSIATYGIDLKWNCNQNTIIFIKEKAFENIV